MNKHARITLIFALLLWSLALVVVTQSVLPSNLYAIEWSDTEANSSETEQKKEELEDKDLALHFLEAQDNNISTSLHLRDHQSSRDLTQMDVITPPPEEL